ncbi:hypothetical protein MKX03_014199 [Papaver bracteatum]|nr:hypothetical protein MKX03_014199 [Papaver bracteatum]
MDLLDPDEFFKKCEYSELFHLLRTNQLSGVLPQEFWGLNGVRSTDDDVSENLLVGGMLDSVRKISYEMVSYVSQEPEATVFLSSAFEAKIGTFCFSNKYLISRRVCFVRYPEFSELEEKAKSEVRMFGSTECKNTELCLHLVECPEVLWGIHLLVARARRGKLSDGGEPSSKHPMKRRVNEPTRTIPHAVNFSGGHGSSVTTTSSGSASSENSKKKKKKRETKEQK